MWPINAVKPPQFHHTHTYSSLLIRVKTICLAATGAAFWTRAHVMRPIPILMWLANSCPYGHSSKKGGLTREQKNFIRSWQFLQVAGIFNKMKKNFRLQGCCNGESKATSKNFLSRPGLTTFETTAEKWDPILDLEGLNFARYNSYWNVSDWNGQKVNAMKQIALGVRYIGT